jgi:hypothetical protein
METGHVAMHTWAHFGTGALPVAARPRAVDIAERVRRLENWFQPGNVRAGA